MNFIDLTILIVAALFCIRGVIRGFVLEITSILGLLAGYLLALFYLERFSQLVLSYFPTLSRTVVHVAGFMILFVLTNLALKLAAHLLTRTLKVAMLGWLNRLLGGVTGLLKGTVILSALAVLVTLLPGSSFYLQKAGAAQSTFYPVLNALGPELYKWITQFVKTI